MALARTRRTMAVILLFLWQTKTTEFFRTEKKIQWQTALYPTKKWGITYTGYYQRRSFDDEGHGDNPLRDVFDLSSVPGFTEGLPVKQLYNELALDIDTRDAHKMISPGWRGEVYAGISAGLGKNESDTFKTGLDVAAFIPTLKEDRIISPRIVLDITEELDNTLIPFTEYPRHRTFRGISSRDLILNDQVSLTPSLEYQWPLSHMFSGHVFLDYLAVGPTVGKIDWDDGIWAAGFGINFHYANKEFGRLELAGGSEGFQLTFKIKEPVTKNSRTDW